MSDAREDQIRVLLAQAGFAGAVRSPVAGDASTRAYERLHRQGARAILMDAPPRAETAPCPPTASAEERARLGYNAQARLAAGRVDAFLAIAKWLSGLGLSAPNILAADAEHGLAVIEDFGDDQYWALLQTDQDAGPLYDAAIDALVQLHEETPPARLPVGAGQWPLLAYDRVAMRAEVALLPEWFGARQLNRPISDDALAQWLAAWDAALDRMETARPVMALRDFHSPNLMWLPGRSGAKRAGLLDFQDALVGHAAFDLVSLLEDARRTIAPDFAAHWRKAYLDRAGVIDREGFEAAYAVLGAERNAKIIGIFARLKHRDGKPNYVAQHQPRVIQYFRRNLEHPALADVSAWFAEHLPVESWADPASAAA
jgi:N-acetylmuramate 1-kinase